MSKSQRLVISVVLLFTLCCLINCYVTKFSDTSYASQLTDFPEQATSDLNSNPCLNVNVFWRFLRTGNFECKVSIPIDLTDNQKRPIAGAIYGLLLEVYLTIPVGKFANDIYQEQKTVVLPQQTAFITAQLVDDPDNKKPLYASVKLSPKVTYTFNSVCSIKLSDFKLNISEITAPDAGKVLQSRVPAVVDGLLEFYKPQLLNLIQKAIDAVENSNYCWYYNYMFNHYGRNNPKIAKIPSTEDIEKAKTMVESHSLMEMDSTNRDNVYNPKSDVDAWNAKKQDEFNQSVECHLPSEGC